ncbi:uncharacterized protein [Amphiura filiformis]|uniref:uncharacterized protein n=1 Tax=Amphiura filiformis TaxID=82378 RepID=UPI003B210A3E
MAKTHECETCGREFPSKYNLGRHRCTQHWQNERVIAVCDVCGKIFSRLDNMRQHRKIHDKPNDSNVDHDCDKENQLDSSRVNNDRKRKRDDDLECERPRKMLGTTFELPNEMVEELADDPDLLQYYRQHWSWIRSSVKKGKIQSKYNCHLPTLDPVNLANCAEEVFSQQTTAFKVNASFGFILRNNETNERRFYYSSKNTKLFEKPFLVKDRATFDTFYNTLKDIDSLEYARMQRPDSKWTVEIVTNVTFYVYRIRDHPIGACSYLPDYILQNRAVVSLMINNNTKKPYKDNLCLFRCMALHKGHHKCGLEKQTKALFKEYSNQSSQDFKGIKVDQLHEVEDVFGVNIMVYELVDLGADVIDDHNTEETEKNMNGMVVARLVRRSLEKHSSTMYINLHNEHFSYISNIDKYTQSYACRKCHKLWKTGKQLHRHEATCEDQGTTDVYPRGVYVNSPSIFDEIREEDIDIPKECDFFPHWATFDFESYTEKTSVESGGDKLCWMNEHIPSVLVSVVMFQDITALLVSSAKVTQIK